jgi:putative peptidoglycan lipid II flippase
MAAVTLLSRTSGYLRDKTVAALLGAGNVTDAFYAALAIPSMFRAFLAEGALHAAFIPTLSELREREDLEAQRQFVRAMAAALLMILPVVVGAGVLAAPLLVRLFAHGLERDPAAFALAIRLTRLMFPYLALISLAALAQGVLNAANRFLLPAATPMALNLFIVAGTVTVVEVLHARWEWLAVGVLAGGASQLVMQLPACGRLGLPLRPGGGGFRHPEVRRVLALMVPGIPALGVYQVTLLLSYRFASSVSAGAITGRFNASRLNELIYGVVIVQLTTAVLPMLAAERARDPERARSTLAFAIRIMSVVAVPSAVITVVLARRITGTAFGGGAYSAQDVAMTAGALAMYAWGLPFLGLTKLFAGASYAWKDTRRPVVAAAVNLVIFWLLGTWWTPLYGIAGIAAAASAGQAVNASVLLGLGVRKGWAPRAGEVLPGVARHLVAAGVAGFGAYTAQRWLPPMQVTSVRSLALLAAVVLASAMVYLGSLVVLRAPEWRDVLQLLRTRRRVRAAPRGGGS